MTSDIEELFVQIVSSEQKARERKAMINDVKIKSQKCDAEIKLINKDIARLNGQLELKVQQLNSTQLELKCEMKRKCFLEEEKAKLEKACNELKERLDRVVSNHNDRQLRFVSDVQMFCSRYDLLSNCEGMLQTQWLEEIRQLKESQRQLEEDLRSYREHQSNVEILGAESAERLIEIESNRSRLNELKLKLEAEKHELIRLEEEKKRISQVNHTNPEFVRLQRELSSYQTSGLESICSRLKQELETLEREQWQKQIRSTVRDRKHTTRQGDVHVKAKKTAKTVVSVTPSRRQSSATVVLTNYKPRD